MRYFAGLDVSLEETTICVVDENGVIVKEVRATSEPEALISSRSARWPPHDGVRRASRPNLFHGLASACWQDRDSQRDRLARRPHGNDLVHPRGRIAFSDPPLIVLRLRRC
jgi:hypothetical protein